MASVSAQQLILNGGFDASSIGPNRQVVVNANTSAYTQVDNWTTSNNTDDLTFLFSANAADTTGANGRYYATNRFKLWGPGTGVSNGLGPSPLGGNFLASDGDSKHNVPISQTVNGLTIGASYDLSFYWAAAQQFTFDGATTEKWDVTFGNQTFSTPIHSLPNHGFSGWMQQSMTFTANSATQVLSFLAIGTPNGLPPFVLLDGVSLQAVPEPSTSLLIFGAVCSSALFRRRRNNR